MSSRVIRHRCSKLAKLRGKWHSGCCSLWQPWLPSQLSEKQTYVGQRHLFSYLLLSCGVTNFPESYKCQLPAPRMAYNSCVKLAPHSLSMLIVSRRPWALHLLLSKRNHKHPQTSTNIRFCFSKRGLSFHVLCCLFGGLLSFVVGRSFQCNVLVLNPFVLLDNYEKKVWWIVHD